MKNTDSRDPTLHWELFIRQRGSATQGVPPGNEALTWVANTVTLIWGEREKELFGGEAATTNNRMELTAVIRALESLKRSCDVDIYTDSQYVKNGIETWIHGWKRNGWKTAERKGVKNDDLWRELDAAASRHRIRWHWVRGHNDHPLNERADALANRGVTLAARVESGS